MSNRRSTVFFFLHRYTRIARTNGLRREARNCVKFLSNLTRDRVRIRGWIKTKATRIGLESCLYLILYVSLFQRRVIIVTSFKLHEFKYVFFLCFFSPRFHDETARRRSMNFFLFLIRRNWKDPDWISHLVGYTVLRTAFRAFHLSTHVVNEAIHTRFHAEAVLTRQQLGVPVPVQAYRAR